LIFLVLTIIRSNALAQANKEVNQMMKAKCDMLFLMTFLGYVVVEVLVWVLMWLTLGKYGYMAYVWQTIWGGIVWLLVEFHWNGVVRAWSKA
jgi:hypothetical protein